MNTYLVGGAVRDRLLGRAVKDHDHVVTIVRNSTTGLFYKENRTKKFLLGFTE